MEVPTNGNALHAILAKLITQNHGETSWQLRKIKFTIPSFGFVSNPDP